MGKSSKSLKTALRSQQTRFKVKQKASHAAQIVEQKSRKRPAANRGKGKVALTQRPTIPLQATDTILLIGEGNFSFARALARPSPSRTELAHLVHLPAKNITATAYDSEEDCYAKYPDAQDIVASLREWGVEVLFGVDATMLEWIPALKGRAWSKILFNFPHAGKGIDDQDRNILSNQMLILDFLRSAAKFLKKGPIPHITGKKKRKVSDLDEDESQHEDEAMDDIDAPLTSQMESTRGTILITLRNVPPYTLWDIPRLAKNPPSPQGSTPPNPQYLILRSFVFHRDIWDGYEHRMTKGSRAHGTGKTGEGGEDRTWEFCLKDSSTV